MDHDAYRYLSREDRARIAQEQATQFERQRFAHELDVLRLDALPESKRDDAWGAARQTALDAIEALDIAIKATEDAVQALVSPDER